LLIFIIILNISIFYKQISRIRFVIWNNLENEGIKLINTSNTICFITNIPAPYRERIHEIVASELGNYKVIYCHEKESNRVWNFSYGKYVKYFLKKRVLNISGRYVHFNFDVINVLNAIKPSVVITDGYTPTYLFSFLWSKLNRKKHICMSDGWLQSERNLSFFHKMLRKIIVKRSHAWIGASKHSMVLLKFYGAKQEGIFQSHLCIDNATFKSLPFGNRNYDIMFSGQFIHRKMPDFFSDVAGIIKKKSGICKTLVLGSGQLEERFKNNLRNNNVEASFKGFIQQDDLPIHYSNAKIFLFPTREEPWGIVANEACAAGTPVITCNNAGAANDLIIDGYNGFILPLNAELWADHAIKLLGNIDIWKKISNNAIQKVKEYNFENAASGIISAVKYSLSQ
jgi:glycosyltransferase involved in cell wall biosynthesis